MLERHIHQMGSKQWEYNKWLSDACGPDVQQTSPWRVEVYDEAAILRRKHAAEYREHWTGDDYPCIKAARQEFEAFPLA